MPGEDVLYELAARLGSPVTFDRHGWVVWMDGFEEGVAKWYDSGSGVGHSLTVSSARVRNGGWSALLTTGDALYNDGAMIRYLAYPMLSVWGLEFSFTLGTDIARFDCRFDLFDGTDWYRAMLIYQDSAHELRYVNEVGSEVAFASNVDLRVSTELFLTMKLVVDWETHEYVRALVNEQTYSLVGIPVSSVSSGEAPHMRVTLLCRNSAAANRECHVDDVIITQNEP